MIENGDPEREAVKEILGGAIRRNSLMGQEKKENHGGSRDLSDRGHVKRWRDEETSLHFYMTAISVLDEFPAACASFAFQSVWVWEVFCYQTG